jgi:hypothetical protein
MAASAVHPGIGSIQRLPLAALQDRRWLDRIREHPSTSYVGECSRVLSSKPEREHAPHLTAQVAGEASGLP